MDFAIPASIEGHAQVIEANRARAEAIPEDEVVLPDMPVKTFIEEAKVAASGARQHFADLARVGLKAAMVEALEADIKALDSAQVLWNKERRGGYDEATQKLIDASEDYREDLLSAADLALRSHSEGRRRISTIREGDGLPDLISDLKDLAVLVTDFSALFEDINLDVDVAPEEAVRLAGGLSDAIKGEKVGKTLSGYKDLRDRFYTLTRDSLDEVRQFTTRAFRKDKTNARRGLFTSAYIRRRDAMSKKKRAAAQQSASEAGV